MTFVIVRKQNYFVPGCIILRNQKPSTEYSRTSSMAVICNMGFGVYEEALKQDPELNLSKGQTKRGLRRTALPILHSLHSGSTASTSSTDSTSNTSSTDGLDSSLHIRQLVENDNSSCRLSLQNSADLTRRRRDCSIKIVQLLEESLSEVGLADSDNGSVASRISALTEGSQAVSKKRVRFRLSKNEYYFSSEEPFTVKEKQAAWWTVEDYDRAVAVTEEFIDSFHKQNREPMHDLIRLVALCFKSKDEDSIDWTKAVSLTPNVSRGFESEILPPLRQSRKRHTKTVLSTAFRSPDDDELVAECSRALSKPHSLLSIVYAKRDHQAAMQAATLPWRKRRDPSRQNQKDFPS